MEVDRVLKIKEKSAAYKTTPLMSVLQETHPHLPPVVLRDTVGIISVLMTYMNPDPEQVKMMLRGGSFRRLYYHHTIFDDALLKIWNIPEIEFGDASDLAKNVVGHMAGEIMDIDIRLNEGGVVVDGDNVIRPNDEIIPYIMQSYLRERGWIDTGVSQEKSEIFELENGEYLVQVSSFPIGRTHKRPHHTVIFRSKADGHVIQEIGFADFARTLVEEKEDIRYLANGMSADMILTGDIWERKDNGLPAEKRVMVSYLDEADEDIELALLEYQVSQKYARPHTGFVTHYAESLIIPVRSMNWFIGHWAASLRYSGDVCISDRIEGMEAWLGYSKNPYEVRESIRELLKGSARDQLPNIKELVVPLLSDLLYLVSANPYHGLMMGYASGLLDTLNLGQILKSKDKLKNLFAKMGEAIGFSNGQESLKQEMPILFGNYIAYCLEQYIDPSQVLLDSLQNMDYSDEEQARLRALRMYPPDVPRTVSSLLELLLPVGLTMEDMV